MLHQRLSLPVEVFGLLSNDRHYNMSLIQYALVDKLNTKIIMDMNEIFKVCEAELYYYRCKNNKNNIIIDEDYKYYSLLNFDSTDTFFEIYYYFSDKIIPAESFNFMNKNYRGHGNCVNYSYVQIENNYLTVIMAELPILKNKTHISKYPLKIICE